MGRLFMTSPEMFFRIATPLITVGPFLVAIATIIWAGRKYKIRGLVAVAIGLLLIPLVGMPALEMLRSLGGGTQGLGLLSNQQILQSALPKGIDQPWVWRELATRVSGDRLTGEEVDRAFQVLAAHLKKQPVNGPLSWQQSFIKAVDSKNLGSQDARCVLADAFFGPPQLQLHGRQQIGIRYGSPWGRNNGVGLELLFEVKSVSVAGQKVAFKNDTFGGQNRSLMLNSPLPPSDDVQVELDCAYVHTSKLFGLNLERLDEKVMPDPMKRWSQVVSLNVSKKLGKPSLVTAPKRDPTSSLAVSRIVVHNDREGGKLFVLELNRTSSSEDVDFCSELYLHVDEVNMVDMGNAYWHREGDSTSSSGNTYRGRFSGRLDDDIKFVDIELKPNVEYATEKGIFQEIWGKTIRLHDIPIERLDLESGR